MKPLHPSSLLTPLLALCAGLSAGHAVAAPASARHLPPEVVAPLLADDGTAFPSAHRDPAAEAAAGGQAPGWASAAQRDQLQRLHPRRVVRMRAAAPGAAPPPAPARDSWVFVEGAGADPVRLARRLAAEGVEHVWVVVPGRVVATPAQAGPVIGRSQP